MFPLSNVMLSYGRDLLLMPKFAPLYTLLQCLYYVFRLLFRIYLHNKTLAINVFVGAVYRQYINIRPTLYIVTVPILCIPFVISYILAQ